MIAFDTSTSGTDGGNNITWSHTCSGSSRLLFIYCIASAPSNVESIGSVTYNSVSMTQLAKTKIHAAADYYSYIYYLLNPSSGSNTISVTGNGVYGRAASFSGVLQSGFPDAQVTNAFSTPTTSMTQTLTTVADNCWLFGGGSNDSGVFTAGANTTIRQQANSVGIWDSNAARSAGSNSVAVTFPSGGVSGLCCSFAPAPPSGNNLFFSQI